MEEIWVVACNYRLSFLQSVDDPSLESEALSQPDLLGLGVLEEGMIFLK